MNVIGQAHSLIHDAGVPRVHTDVKGRNAVGYLTRDESFPILVLV